MIVDCDRCTVRGDACRDCVITVVLGAPPGGVELDAADCAALESLAAAGMVPRLQLVGDEKGYIEPGEAGMGKRAQRSESRAGRSSRRAG